MTNPYRIEEEKWTPQEIYSVEPPKEFVFGQIDYVEGTDGVDYNKAKQSAEAGSRSFTDSLVGGIGKALRGIFPRPNIPPVEVPPLFNVIKTNLEEALTPMFRDVDTALEASRAKGEEIEGKIAIQGTTIEDLRTQDSRIENLITGVDGVNSRIESLRSSMDTKVSDQGKLITDLENAVEDDSIATQEEINRINTALWGSQNIINLDNQSQWQAQGFFNRVQKELWSEQGKFNQLVINFIETQHQINTLQNQISDELAESTKSLRDAVENQGEFISRSMFIPSAESGVTDDYIVATKNGSELTLEALGTWTGTIVIQGRYIKKDFIDGGRASFYEPYLAKMSVPEITATPRKRIIPDIGSQDIFVNYWVSKEIMKASDMSIGYTGVPKDVWHRIDAMTFTVERAAWHSMFYTFTWDAATYHSTYGGQVVRIRGTDRKVLSIVGPETRVGPLLPGFNGNRTRSWKAEMGEGELVVGDKIVFEVFSSGEEPSQRALKSAKRMITWRVPGDTEV